MTAWLTIRRTDEADMQERELYVWLDGQKLGILRYGDSATVPIAPGRHQLRVHNTLSRRRAEFEAAPGQELRFSTANVKGKGFAYLAIFVGAAFMHTRLEREADGPGGVEPAPRPFRY